MEYYRELAGSERIDFWSFIESFDWCSDYNYIRCRDELYSTYSNGDILYFKQCFAEVRKALWDKLILWEKNNKKAFNLGDDSLGDLISHIIGLGKSEYIKTLVNPELAYKRALHCAFVESFSYMFLAPTIDPDEETIKDENFFLEKT